LSERRIELWHEERSTLHSLTFKKLRGHVRRNAFDHG
jgi:hypothetical protein